MSIGTSDSSLPLVDADISTDDTINFTKSGTRLLGLDFGSKTVGVAISDPLFMTAQPLETITRTGANKLRRTLSRIGELIEAYGVSEIVLGYPVNMDGTEGARCEATIEFKKLLEKRFSLPVILQNEQLSTVEADEVLSELGVAKSERKQHIDKIAASIILRDYMDEK